MSLPVAILAGGLATRLRPLTERIPKSLVEVAGKPFAEHQIELLRRNGIMSVVFCVGYLGEQIEETLGDGCRWGITIRYVYDGPSLLGTGGAVRRALPALGDGFMVLYGDSYLDCDYAAVERAFWASGKLGLMTVFRKVHLDERCQHGHQLPRLAHLLLVDREHLVRGAGRTAFGAEIESQHIGRNAGHRKLGHRPPQVAAGIAVLELAHHHGIERGAGNDAQVASQGHRPR